MRWSLERTTKVSHYLILNSRELLALYLARSMLQPLKETPFFRDLSTTFDKIEEKISTKGHDYLKEVSNEFHFEPSPKWGGGLNPEVIDTVRASCTENQVLKINYSSVNSKTTRDRLVGPHFLYFSKGSLYMVAKDLDDGKNKVFGVPRINSAEMLDQAFDSDAIDPGEFFNSAFGIYRCDQPEKIELEFKPPISEFIRERRWHETQRVVNKQDGMIHLTMEVGITPELVQWILGYGPAVKILNPKTLRDEVQSQARVMLRMYGDYKEAS